MRIAFDSESPVPRLKLAPTPPLQSTGDLAQVHCSKNALTAASRVIATGASLGVLIGGTLLWRDAIGKLALIAMVPLIVTLRTAPPARAVSIGWLAGTVANAIVFYWIPTVIAMLQHRSWGAALVPAVGYWLWHGLQLGLFATSVVLVRASGFFALGVAAGWVVVEWMFPKVLPWPLGQALASSPWLRQVADLGGMPLLSFLVVFANGYVAVAVFDTHGSLRRPSGRLLLLPCAVLLLWSAYGAWATARFESTEFVAAPTVRVAILQGNLHSGRTDFPQVNEDAWRTYADLTSRDSVRGADLVIWPETTLRLFLRTDEDYRGRLRKLVDSVASDVLVGSLDSSDGGERAWNAAYLIHPEARFEVTESWTDEIYHKQLLLPFGEYVPGVSWLPFLQGWQTTGPFFAAAAPQHPLHLKPNGIEFAHQRRQLVLRESAEAPSSPQFAPSICFEAVWPGAMNEMVREGAEFLVNITDDGWFGGTAAPGEHLDLARMRAVETRRWLVRASNSGISAFVDPLGEIRGEIPFGNIGVLQRQIQLLSDQTIYARFGEWVVVMSAGWLIGRIRLQRKRDA